MNNASIAPVGVASFELPCMQASLVYLTAAPNDNQNDSAKSAKDWEANMECSKPCV